MDFETQQELSKHINPSEHILWAGRPKTGIIFRWFDAPITAFSAFWLWGWSRGFSRHIGGEDGFSFEILPMLFGFVVGFYFLFGRFIHDAWRRSRTHYGLTEHRVIILTGPFRNTLTSIPLRALRDFSLKEKSDGSGTIVFAPKGVNVWSGGKRYTPGMPYGGPPAIEEIPNVKSVYDQILAAQQEEMTREKSGWERDY